MELDPIIQTMLRVCSFLLLVFGSCVSSQSLGSCPAQTPPPALYGPGNLSSSQQLSNQGFMSPIVHSFLGSVQPNPFPTDLITNMMRNPGAVTNSETAKQVLQYEIGFLVCVAIGILYIILMPLIGLFFACCRCCGNCGGRMYQKQSRSTNCRRICFYWATLLITVLILAGNICMFLSNKYTADSVNSAPSGVRTVLQNLDGYLSTIPKQLDQVIKESFATVDTVSLHVNDTGTLLGKEIQNGLRGPFNSSLNSIGAMAQVVYTTRLWLVKLNGTLSQLQTQLNFVQNNLTTVRNSINTTLHNSSCAGCSSFQFPLDSLSLDTSLNIPNLNNLQSSVDQAANADLNASLKTATTIFEDIPQTVTNETKNIRQGVQQQLNGIRNQISQVTTDIPVSSLNDISSLLDNVRSSVDLYTPTVNNAETIRSAIAVVLCCLILLVVVCNLLGLLLGPVGLQPKDDPTERSGTSNCAGIFLMMGVGFSFLFSWLFMIIVLILFLVFGNTYTLICVPWQSGQLYQLIDNSRVVQELRLPQGLSNLTVSQVYRNCQMNNSLWTTLHLQDIIDLNDFLNISKYTVQMQQSFDNSAITLPMITLLTTQTQNQLLDFSNRANSVNFSSFVQKMNAVSGINLLFAANNLSTLAANQGDADIKKNLLDEANQLRDIQGQINLTITPLVLQLNDIIGNLSVIASQINNSVGDVLMKVKYAQDFFNNNTTQIVKKKTTEFVNCQLRIFEAFATWANQTITGQVGRCGPVAAAVDATENLVCTQLVDSLNGFWFSLGWCMIFLIPSIIFSVKLAKFYRRMQHSDAYDNNIMMSPIPRAKLF